MTSPSRRFVSANGLLYDIEGTIQYIYVVLFGEEGIIDIKQKDMMVAEMISLMYRPEISQDHAVYDCTDNTFVTVTEFFSRHGVLIDEKDKADAIAAANWIVIDGDSHEIVTQSIMEQSVDNFGEERIDDITSPAFILNRYGAMLRDSIGEIEMDQNDLIDSDLSN